MPAKRRLDSGMADAGDDDAVVILDDDEEEEEEEKEEQGKAGRGRSMEFAPSEQRQQRFIKKASRLID